MSSEEFHASNPLGIKKKAQGPRFDALPEFRDDKVVAQPKPAPVPVDVATKIAELKEPRIGPYFVKYSMWMGGATIAYTYLSGFRYLYQKNKPAWENTFKQRIFIMTPLIAMYVAGYGLLPMPFKSSIEAALKRPSISLMDIYKYEKEQTKKAEEAARDVAQKRAEEWTDKQTKAA